MKKTLISLASLAFGITLIVSISQARVESDIERISGTTKSLTTITEMTSGAIVEAPTLSPALMRRKIFEGLSEEPTCEMQIRTIAGNGIAAFSGDGGAATSASLNHPTGVVVDSAGNLYIVDSGNFMIRKVDRSGMITTAVDLRPFRMPVDPSSHEPRGITINSQGHIVFGDNTLGPHGGIPGRSSKRAVRAIDGMRNLWTVVELPQTYTPPIYSIAFDSEGNLYYTTTPFKGGGGDEPWSSGFEEKQRVWWVSSGDLYQDPSKFIRDKYKAFGTDDTEFLGAAGLFYDPPTAALHVAEAGGNRVESLFPFGGRETTLAGTGLTGWSDGLPGLAGNCGPATHASVNVPLAVTTDSKGFTFIADTANHRIRMIDLNQKISVYAGNGEAGFSGDGDNPVKASLKSPEGIAVDSNGKLYVADTQNHRIRVIECITPLPPPITPTPPPFRASGQTVPGQAIDTTIPGQTTDTAPAPAMKSGDPSASKSFFDQAMEFFGFQSSTEIPPALSPQGWVPPQTGPAVDPSTISIYGRYKVKPPIEFTVTPEFTTYDFKPDLFSSGEIKFTAMIANNSDDPATVSVFVPVNIRLSEESVAQSLQRNLSITVEEKVVIWDLDPSFLAAKQLVTLQAGERRSFDFRGIVDYFGYNNALADACILDNPSLIPPRRRTYRISKPGIYKLTFTYRYDGIDDEFSNVLHETLTSPEVTIHVQ